MFLQFDLGCESHHAALAVQFRSLQARMAAFVSRQLRRALELELADVAGVRPLPCVSALMQLSLAEGEERLLAVSAGEGPLSRVNEVVSGQSVRFGEALAAVAAGVRAGPLVGDDVLLQGFLGLETLVTLRAGEGLLICVRPVMFGELPL